MSKYAWLNDKHEIYTASESEWRMNERRLRGGPLVLNELVPFDWEDPKGDHYRRRREQATYINFMDIAATILNGHLLRQAPEADDALSFGTLGPVTRPTGVREPSRAELIYYNVDGTGADGSQWYPWWMGALKRAQATGHRWIMVEATGEAPASLDDEIRGLRPYLVEYSPLAVTNWHVEAGRLMWAVISIRQRRPRVVGGRLEGNRSGKGFYLLVRKGYEDLGEEFAGGGWWKFDEGAEKIEGEHGTWDKTGGEIPMFPLFYDRDLGSDEEPSMSRPGLTPLGQVAVSYMNQSSAADFDAWDAAKSAKFLLGVEVSAFNTAVEKWKGGNQLIPVPRGQDGQMPQIVDGSASAVTSDVFKARLDNKWEEARVLAALEASGSPDSSGLAKQMGFQDIKSPRLAAMASNLEQAQNAAIHFLELRFGTTTSPEGAVTWPREYDLSDILTDISELLSIERQAGLQSATLDARLVLRAAREKGLVADDGDADQIEQELLDSAERRSRQTMAASALFGEFGEF